MEFLIILGILVLIVYAAYRHILAGEQQRPSRRGRQEDVGIGFHHDGSHHGCDHSHSDSGDFDGGGCDGGDGGGD